MIKLEQIEKPKQLTDIKQKQFTKDFENTGKNVWNKKYIKEQLKKMSNNKCCYCEVEFVGRHMEVEHFYPKKIFPAMVVVWENLLPSCKDCNGNKGSYNTKKEAIIKPTIQNPKEHIYLQDFRFFPKNDSEIGQRTINLLKLNDRKRLYEPRTDLGYNIYIKLDNILKLIENISPDENKSTEVSEL